MLLRVVRRPDQNCCIIANRLQSEVGLDINTGEVGSQRWTAAPRYYWDSSFHGNCQEEQIPSTVIAPVVTTSSKQKKSLPPNSSAPQKSLNQNLSVHSSVGKRKAPPSHSSAFKTPALMVLKIYTHSMSVHTYIRIALTRYIVCLLCIFVWMILLVCVYLSQIVI